MEPTPLPLSAFSEAVRRNVDPDAPLPMKLMAARGLLPLGPGELAMTLYQLALDADSTVASAARKTMTDAPDAVVVPAAGAAIDGRVLDWIATVQPRREPVIEAIVSNRGTSDDTIVRIAGACSESISELIAMNEVRVLRTPRIIEALYVNANARMSTIDRLIDLAKRHGITFQTEALQNLLDDPGYDTAAAAIEAASREFDGDADTLFKQLLEESLAGGDEDGDDDDEEREDEDENRHTTNMASRIMAMTISEKMRMATLGNKAEREFLVRDSNRLVHMAAVMSPKIQLRDIQAWSGNRVMPDTVLTFIANHRRYRRVYSIVVNLANNPKVPVKDGLKLLPQLVEKDLKVLLKNRNVSHQIRRQAKAIQEARHKKSGR